jgi:3-oxoacyl-[acyl-carrier protein] reductase
VLLSRLPGLDKRRLRSSQPEKQKGDATKVLEKGIGQVPIGRLIEPQEVASFVGDVYRNEALAGDVFFIHGGLRLSAKG